MAWPKASADAEAHNMHYIDHLPAGEQVHREAERDHDAGHHILLIGHAGAGSSELWGS